MNLSKSSSIIGLGGRKNADRQPEDFYATEPKVADLLVKAETLSNHIWECACGAGHLSNRFRELKYLVWDSDIVNRNCDWFIKYDFINDEDTTYVFREDSLSPDFSFDIVTNPPFKLAERFIEKGMNFLKNGRKLCLFLKLTFLESAGRDELFKKYPPIRIHVCKKRIKCAKNGDFSQVKSSPTCYAWFVWEKGFSGKTTIDRI